MLVHSAWTKPMRNRWYINDQIKSNTWLYALSVHYAKKVGANIVLHTDADGERIFGCLPYDNIYRTLDPLNKCTHHRLWASGKMIAHENSPLGCIHIDGDVFIKTEKALAAITLIDEDVVVQSVECLNDNYISDCYNDNLNIVRKCVDNDTMRLIMQYRGAYNTGVFGFGSENMKHEYLGNYWDTANKLCCNQQFVQEMDNNENLCPDIIVEQMHIYALCKKYNAITKFVLCERDNMQEKANEIGYTHVIGKEKYNRIDEVKNRLQQENPELFWRVLNHIKTL
jgi:hypothetical protein